MYQIAVIGAGQLGSRHLQGLASLKGNARFHVVDPSEASARQASSRFVETAGEESAALLSIHQSASTLPQALDFVVVATTADRRLAALDSLLRASHVKTVLLEKVLFQQFAEYAEADRLMHRHGVLAWVNCPRRAYPVYRTLKEWFASDPVVHMEVAGGSWGLGCNGVHFIDLFAFITGTTPERYDASGLDPGVSPARRTGFFEYTGTLRANAAAASLAITSMRDSSARHLVTFRSRKQHVVIDEGTGTLWRVQEAADSELANFKLPFQSQMTGDIARQLLEQDSCELTPYAESAAIHLGFLRALAAHSGGPSAAACLVT